MKQLRTPRSGQGQALTEFIVAALFLVPLFLLIPMIAKYQDMAHAAQLASRYVAFEATNRNDGMGNAGFSSAGELAGEVGRRFFSYPDAAIKSGDTAGNFMAHQNPFWRDQHGNALVDPSKVVLSFGPGQAATPAAGRSNAADDRPFNFGLVNVRNALGLQAGMYTANVSVNVANLPSALNGYTKSFDEFGNIGLNIRRHTSIAIDSWTASGPDQVADRIDATGIFPARLLNDDGAGVSVREVVGTAVAVTELPKCFPVLCSNDIGPQLGRLDYWDDVIPADRKR